MKLAFFDIDGTILPSSTPKRHMEFLIQHHAFREENLQNIDKSIQAYLQGVGTYEQMAEAWFDEMGEGLLGQKKSLVDSLSDQFWQTIQPELAPWAKEGIDLLNKHGFQTIAISGSPIELLEVYKKKLGLQEVFGSILQTKDGLYTGQTQTNLILHSAKESIVDNLILNHHTDLVDSFGFGDNENDRAFLDRVNFPIAIYSESKLAEYAKTKDWPIFQFEDMGVLSYIENILKREPV